MSKKVFKNFQEFFSLTRPLSAHQRFLLLESLPVPEKKSLLDALQSEGWEDLFIRNELDGIVDHIKEHLGEDLIKLRIEILSGSTKKVRKSFWSHIQELFSGYEDKSKDYIFGGIKVLESGDDNVLLISSRKKT